MLNLEWLSLRKEWHQGSAPKCAVRRHVFWSSPRISLYLGVCRTQCFTEAFLLPALCFFRVLLPKFGSMWHFKKGHTLLFLWLFVLLWLYLIFLVLAPQLFVESSQVWNTHWPIYLCPCWLLAVWLAGQISSVISVICFVYGMRIFPSVLK